MEIKFFAKVSTLKELVRKAIFYIKLFNFREDLFSRVPK